MGSYRDCMPPVVPSRTLVQALEDLGVGNDATRTALSRLTKQGLLDRLKVGRETSYKLSAQGLSQIVEDEARILHFGDARHWNGQWTIVIFSVSESERAKRHQLKVQLRAYGFAPLQNGVWLAAFAPPSHAQEALNRCGISEAQVFCASYAGDESHQLKLNLEGMDELREDYLAFIDFFEPLLTRPEDASLTPLEAFVVRTRLFDSWRTFPAREPDLPEHLLPESWPMKHARRIFDHTYRDLENPATSHLQALMAE